MERQNKVTEKQLPIKWKKREKKVTNIDKQHVWVWIIWANFRTFNQSHISSSIKNHINTLLPYKYYIFKKIKNIFEFNDIFWETDFKATQQKSSGEWKLFFFFFFFFTLEMFVLLKWSLWKEVPYYFSNKFPNYFISN